jgi:hypothetical protein
VLLQQLTMLQTKQIWISFISWEDFESNFWGHQDLDYFQNFNRPVAVAGIQIDSVS